jgi:Zn-dependent protease with chaperone function
MQARYADGRAAVLHPADAEFVEEGVIFTVNGERRDWAYADLRRADDNNGLIMLRRAPDTGERLILDESARPALKAAAPNLFKPKAHGVESAALVVWLTGAAAALAAVFLVGVPMAAEPIAQLMPERYKMQLDALAVGQIAQFAEFCEGDPDAEWALGDLLYQFTGADSVDQQAVRDVTVRIVRAHSDSPMNPFAQPNAFALPGERTIIINDALIQLAESPDEVAGVLAHELGHIAHHHVTSNVIRNVGAGIFLDVVFGGAGAGQTLAMASVNLAALKYDREDEAEADASALDYLDAAHIDPSALARFFDRIGAYVTEHGGSEDFPTLLSSHPATAERAAAARARARPGSPALTAEDWQAVRSACAIDGETPAEPSPGPTPSPIPGPPSPKPPPMPDKPGKPS